MRALEVVRLIADQGSLLLFAARDNDTGTEVNVAIDHRPAQDILIALENGEEVTASFDEWQILGG